MKREIEKHQRGKKCIYKVQFFFLFWPYWNNSISLLNLISPSLYLSLLAVGNSASNVIKISISLRETPIARSGNDTNDCQCLLMVMRVVFEGPVALRARDHHFSGPGEGQGITSPLHYYFSWRQQNEWICLSCEKEPSVNLAVLFLSQLQRSTCKHINT